MKFIIPEKFLYADRSESIADDEEWKPLPSPHHRFLVSNYGRTRCGNNRPRKIEISWDLKSRRGRVWASIRDLTRGGKMTTINIPRAVYKLYIWEIPEEMEVNHRDGNAFNNYYKNLFITDDWWTNNNAKNLKLNPFKPPILKTKISKETIKNIRKDYIPRKFSTPMLAKKYWISQAHIMRIIHNKNFWE